MINARIEEEKVLRRIDNSILVKILQREIKESLGVLKVNKDINMIAYNQGVVASLEQTIEIISSKAPVVR